MLLVVATQDLGIVKAGNPLGATAVERNGGVGGRRRARPARHFREASVRHPVEREPLFEDFHFDAIPVDILDSEIKDADAIVKEEGLVQITDTGAIEEIVKQVIANNPQPVADFKGGNGKAIGFLVGQVMKESKGRANPGMVNQLLQKFLND